MRASFADLRPPLGRLRSLTRNRSGAAAVEFGILLPVLMIVFYGITETGRAVMQAHAVTRGLRTGAMYAAMAPQSLDSSDVDAIENLVKCGKPDACEKKEYLTGAWADPDASVQISALESKPDGGGGTVQVRTLTASVPFRPIIFDCPGPFCFDITMEHEQVHMGNN